MVKAVIVRSSVDRSHKSLGPQSFAYRFGERYLRLEDIDTLERRAQRLVIINGTDVWDVDKIHGTGKHFNNQKLPVRFAVLGRRSDAWDGFELGCEEQFMRDVPVNPEPATEGAIAYTNFADGILVHLYVSPDHRPLRVDVQDGRRTYSFNYLEYHWLEPDFTLFKPPTGVTFQEMLPGTTR